MDGWMDVRRAHPHPHPHPHLNPLPSPSPTHQMRPEVAEEGHLLVQRGRVVLQGEAAGHRRGVLLLSRGAVEWGGGCKGGWMGVGGMEWVDRVGWWDGQKDCRVVSIAQSIDPRTTHLLLPPRAEEEERSM